MGSPPWRERPAHHHTPWARVDTRGPAASHGHGAHSGCVERRGRGDRRGVQITSRGGATEDAPWRPCVPRPARCRASEGSSRSRSHARCATRRASCRATRSLRTRAAAGTTSRATARAEPWRASLLEAAPPRCADAGACRARALRELGWFGAPRRSRGRLTGSSEGRVGHLAVLRHERARRRPSTAACSGKGERLNERVQRTPSSSTTRSGIGIAKLRPSWSTKLRFVGEPLGHHHPVAARVEVHEHAAPVEKLEELFLLGGGVARHGSLPYHRSRGPSRRRCARSPEPTPPAAQPSYLNR